MPPAKKTPPATKKAPPPPKAAAGRKARPHAKTAVGPKKSTAPAKPVAASKRTVFPSKKGGPAKAAPQATITLKQIAAELAEAHDLPKKVAEAVMGDLVALTTQHLKQGDKIRLAGLGILQVKDRPARMGRNPATGADVKIAASKKIAFRPAKELKEAVL
jgi:DNA-binding protein HU-beta